MTSVRSAAASPEHGAAIQSTDIIPGFERDAHGKPIIGMTPDTVYAFGHLIRMTEQLLLEQFSRGLLSGTTHTCLGQEFAAMSVVRALDHPQDAVLSNHRNHGHFLTYSGNFLGLVAEIMGREAGVCGGRGGSQHLAYRQFHSNGVQGGMTGIGVGLAMARKLRDSGGIVTAHIGDGTLGQGLLYESLNLAGLWHVPLLVVVENNGIAQTTPTSQTIAGEIDARGRAFGLPTWHMSDTDPDFFETVEHVVSRIRSEQRPGFLTIDTMRLGPHSKGDDLRSDAEKAMLRERDPLTNLGQRLSERDREAIEQRNTVFIDAVRAAATASPEARMRQAPEHIFTWAARAPAVACPQVPPGSNVRQALNMALGHLLRTNPRVVLLGEDLHDPYGGAFKVTEGLSRAFPERVLSTPISEAGITGAGIGLAIAGMQPVVEVMFADFLSLCMDQIYNHAVKFPGVFPQMQIPLLIRTPAGGRRGYGPTHSQSPEHLFAAVPGLTVVYGSHRHAVAQLLVDATERWPYPTIFFEHKLLYGERQDPGRYRVLQPAAADVAASLFPTLALEPPGAPDLTIVTYGGMLPVVENTLKHLEEEELEVEILVPSLLAPLPKHTLVERLLSSPRVAVVEESHHALGISAEILASLLEAGYRGDAVRIGAPPVPIPSARSLERQMLPDEQRLLDEILDLF